MTSSLILLLLGLAWITDHGLCVEAMAPDLSCPPCPVVDCSPTTTTTEAIVTANEPGVEVCETRQCYSAAGRILSLVDVTKDPCDDFYAYACEGMLKNPLLQNQDPADDVWNRIKQAIKSISIDSPSSHQKLKNYYDGCVKYDQLVQQQKRKKRGRQLLEKVGRFFYETDDFDEEFTDLLINLVQHGSFPLFDLQLDVDSTQSTQFQVAIAPPNWLSSRFLSPEEKTQRCRPQAKDVISENLEQAYNSYINCTDNFMNFVQTTREALEFFGVSDLPPDQASIVTEEIVTTIMSIMEPLTEILARININKAIANKNYELVNKMYLEMEILQLVDWGKFLKTLLKTEIDDHNTNVQMYFKDDLKMFFGLVQYKNPRLLHNALLAVFATQLYSDLVVTHHPHTRESYCLRVTANLLPLITSNLYLGTFSSDSQKELRLQVSDVFKDLVAAMEVQLTFASWLDDRTFNESSKKLKNMKVELPITFSDEALDSSLGECSLTSQEYLEDSVCLLYQLQMQMFSRYSDNPHSLHTKWSHFLTAFSTHTAFIYPLNTYMVPLGLVATVYDRHMPRLVVMATLGNLLARGIGHNFDQTGVKFTAKGKLGVMLSEAANPTYVDGVDTSNFQYAYTKSYREGGRIYSYLLDSSLTLNQRQADMTAANISFSTLAGQNDTQLPWTTFTPSQVYFLTLAQGFCTKKEMPEIFITLYEGSSLPAFDRVNNIAMNSEEFTLAFQCPLGMNMNPVMKARPFPLLESFEHY